MKKLTNEEVLETLSTFTDDKFSLIVSTCDENKIPLTNYAPFVQKDDDFYISVSSSMPHYENMKTQQKAHIMIMEDEKEASHIYARQRLYFNATCEIVTDENPIYALFEKRYGDALSFLKTMKDFKIVKLCPQERSLVLGFGAAYVIDENGMLKNKTISHK